MSLPSMRKLLAVEPPAKYLTTAPKLMIRPEHFGILDPAKHALSSASAQYLNPTMKAHNRAARPSGPSPLVMDHSVESSGDAEGDELTCSGVIVERSPPDATTTTAICGLQTSATAAASLDTRDPHSSSNRPPHADAEDKTAADTLSEDIYESWEIIDTPQETPPCAGATAVTLVVGESPVVCWYCLEPAVKGIECCGVMLDCWCPACNISGERETCCEFCGQELDVFEVC